MSAIVGLGIDLVDCERIAAVYKRYGERFLQRIYTKTERDYCLSHNNPVPHLAARFAVKEAARKALTLGSALSWQDVELWRADNGSLTLRLDGRAASLAATLGVKSSHVSLSHERQMAVAVVVLGN